MGDPDCKAGSGGTAPNMHIVSLKLPPSTAAPRPGPGHKHDGPVFGYVLQRYVENLVDPDPPMTSKEGDVFYEATGHLHRYMYNLSTTQPVTVLAFQLGYTGGANPAIPVLLHEDLLTLKSQEVLLLRLTFQLARIEIPTQLNPAAVYVLDGKVEVAGKVYGPGELFVSKSTSSALKNARIGESSRVLVYQVRDTAGASGGKNSN